jgi:ectoine hydroxylase-related dioxygenase (phytanoyl-CoA dioxygenase family)
METHTDTLTAPALLPLIPSDAGDSLEALRGALDEQGYLFFRGLLPREDVMQVRRDLLDVLQAGGWRAPTQQPLDGRVDLEAISQVPSREMRLDIGVTNEMYHAVQKLESVHRLPHHPQLLALYRKLFENDVLVHPRHIVRMVTAHPAMVPTPHHQDFPLIQGTPATWTAWIPMGDCPRDMGGLAVLRRSHHLGYLPIVKAEGAGNLAAQLCPFETDWATTDYEAGDVLTFPAFTVHRGMPSSRKDEVRLSLDVRYQSSAEPVEAGSLRPHCKLSWDEIYEGWQSSELQRYWEAQSLSVSGWNHEFVQPARRIC